MLRQLGLALAAPLLPAVPSPSRGLTCVSHSCSRTTRAVTKPTRASPLHASWLAAKAPHEKILGVQAGEYSMPVSAAQHKGARRPAGARASTATAAAAAGARPRPRFCPRTGPGRGWLCGRTRRRSQWGTACRARPAGAGRGRGRGVGGARDSVPDPTPPFAHRLAPAAAGTGRAPPRRRGPTLTASKSAGVSDRTTSAASTLEASLPALAAVAVAMAAPAPAAMAAPAAARAADSAAAHAAFMCARRRAARDHSAPAPAAGMGATGPGAEARRGAAVRSAAQRVRRRRSSPPRAAAAVAGLDGPVFAALPPRCLSRVAGPGGGRVGGAGRSRAPGAGDRAGGCGAALA
jgi:hypothetical protein